MELISIIVPVYNVEKYLGDCIESILNQTYKNFELILIDDGSTDESTDICDNYREKDTRIKVIHQRNSGVAQTRNLGLKISRGVYICFVDSDDMVHPQMLEVLYNQIKKNDADISVCDYFEGDKTPSCWEKMKEPFDNVLWSSAEALNLLYGTRKESIRMIVPWCKLYKKALFGNILYPKGKIHEDELTTYKLIYLADKIVYTEKELFFYRQHSSSIMYNVNKSFAELFYFARIEQIKFYKHHNMLKIARKAMYCTEYMLLEKYKMEDVNENTKKKILKIYLRLLKVSWNIIPTKYLIKQVICTINKMYLKK